MQNPAAIAKHHHLPGLNALRFFAALTVVVHHIEQLKDRMGFGSLWNTPVVARMGGQAVTFFFVLSGFLISYLLFHERQENGRIAIKQFYLRRILRIWPLYFTVVIMGLFVFPNFSFFEVPGWSEGNNDGFWIKTALYIFMLPNLVMHFFTPFPGVAQVWSIGVEEQFYLVWPHFFRARATEHGGKRILYAFIATALVMKALYWVVTYGPAGQSPQAFGLVEDLRFGAMAIGAIGAWLVIFNTKRALKILYSPITLIAAFVGIALRLNTTSFFFFDLEIMSLCFLIIIMNVSTNPNSILKLRSHRLDALGKISFGIYMYHISIATLVLHVAASYWGDLPTPWFNTAIYATTICGVLVIAKLSYEFLEKPFLKLKRQSR